MSDTHGIADKSRFLHARNAFSLIELMIVMAIFSLILGGVYATVIAAQNTYVIGTTLSDLESQTRRSLDRIAGEFQDAIFASLDVRETFEIEFQRNIGYQAGAIVPGDLIRIGLEGEKMVLRVDPDGMNEEFTITPWVQNLAENEIANALDDNGNGLIDERGLDFQLNGRTITIRLTLGRTDEDAREYVVSSETSIRLRN